MKNHIQGWKIADSRGRKSRRIPPFAPSANELEFYKFYIRKVRDDKNLPKRALILGATPELRDAAIQSGLKTYAVDVSSQMMKKFSTLMKYKKNKNDVQIIKNWLEMAFPKNFFSLILGDGSLNNLATKKNNEKILKLFDKITCPKGFIVLRQVVYPSTYHYKSHILAKIKQLRNRQIFWQDFYMELRFYMFKDKYFNSKTFQLDNKKVFNEIDALRKNGVLRKNEHKKIITFRNNVTNTIYPEKEFIKLFEQQGFKLIRIFHDQPCNFFKYLYMFAFKKR